MKPGSAAKHEPKTSRVCRKEPKFRLEIVKLEERIPPRLSANHNQTMVCESAQSKPKLVRVRRDPRLKFTIIKLEERIAPKLSANHNETMVRDCPVLDR
jgi:hypothetical protein